MNIQKQINIIQASACTKYIIVELFNLDTGEKLLSKNLSSFVEVDNVVNAYLSALDYLGMPYVLYTSCFNSNSNSTNNTPIQNIDDNLDFKGNGEDYTNDGKEELFVAPPRKKYIFKNNENIYTRECDSLFVALYSAAKQKYDLYSLDETPIYLVENDVDENNKLLIQSNIRFDKKINDLGFEEISFYYQNNDDSEELIFIPNSDLVLL